MLTPPTAKKNAELYRIFALLLPVWTGCPEHTPWRCLDLVVVSAGDEQGLHHVEAHATHGPFVLLEPAAGKRVPWAPGRVKEDCISLVKSKRLETWTPLVAGTYCYSYRYSSPQNTWKSP